MLLTLDFSAVSLRLRQADGKAQVFDPVRRKWLILTPEEHVRQYIINYMTEVMQYPASLMAVEKLIRVGDVNKRFDVVIYSREHVPWMLVECKAPEVPVTEKTLHQLLNYQRNVQCRYWLLTNGHQTFCADAGNLSEIKWMGSLPGYSL